MSFLGTPNDKEISKPEDFAISEPQAFGSLIFSEALNENTKKWMAGRYSADSATYIAMNPPQFFPKSDKQPEIILAKGDILRITTRDDDIYLIVLVPAIVKPESSTSMYEQTTFAINDAQEGCTKLFSCPTIYRLEDRTQLPWSAKEAAVNRLQKVKS